MEGFPMKKIILIAFILATPVSAGELIFEFNSPAFDGGAGYSTQASEEAAIQREIDNSILNKFLTNVQSRIYATLSKQLVDNMFASCDATDTTCSAATSGTATVEGATISWVRDDVNETISLTIIETDGTTTEITVPTGDFAF